MRGLQKLRCEKSYRVISGWQMGCCVTECRERNRQISLWTTSHGTLKVKCVCQSFSAFFFFFVYMASCSPFAVKQNVACIVLWHFQANSWDLGWPASGQERCMDHWAAKSSHDEARLHPPGECYCKRHEQDCWVSLWFQLNCCPYISHATTLYYSV